MIPAVTRKGVTSLRGNLDTTITSSFMACTGTGRKSFLTPCTQKLVLGGLVGRLPSAGFLRGGLVGRLPSAGFLRSGLVSGWFLCGGLVSGWFLRRWLVGGWLVGWFLCGWLVGGLVR